MRAALLLAVLASPAAAQGTQQCAPHDAMTAMLGDRFGETVQSVALTSAGVLHEMFANLETGTWTAVLTRPGQPSCIAAEGQRFEVVEPTAPGDPA